jgi:hypothetical protein
MFHKIEGGTTINIQGLECNIPPEGYVWNIVTKQLEYRGIYSRSSIPEEQYWERIWLPSWYKDTMKRWEMYDKKKKDDDIDFYDEELEKFKSDQWDRRLNGMWYMNNGRAQYLTGMHFMYIQWWFIDIGLPKFRIIDLEYFYFLQYCLEDPNCMGMIEICKRRNGKTFRAGLFVTEYITRTKMTNASIQSKTGNDAKKVFAKAVINPFKKLPRFFRPEYDMSLGITPKTEIRFQQTNVRGKKAEDNLDKEELGSMIDWQSADPLALDGQKEHRVFNDEFAKTIECNIHDRHEVLRYCILDEDGNIIGKLLYSSTVEVLETDREGVQDGAKLLWDESDQLNIQPNKQTISGLYRFFMTALRSKNMDIYGNPDVERTRKEIMANREAVINNPRALSARIRKEPITINEAFSVDGDKSVFNPQNVETRKSELLETPIHKRRIIFERQLDQTVKWRDWKPKSDPDFYWSITPEFELDVKDKKFIIEDKLRKPTRISYGAISIDSYSNSQGGRKYGSKASAFIGYRHLLKPVAHLYGRPKEKDELHNQILLAAEFCGFKAFYEHTADDYYGYFKDRGRVGYLGKYPLGLIDPVAIKKAGENGPERYYGTPITPFSLTRQLDNGIAYFEHHCHLIDFEEILEWAPKFDPYNRTECDIIVSLLILISVLLEPITTPPPRKTPLIQIYENTNYGKSSNNGNLSLN